MSMTARPILFAITLLLAGCDLQTLLADPKVAQKESEAKAIGSACRHAMRSLEDCYSLNDKASKGAIFAGWKDMDQYMRDNKIEGIEPKGLRPSPVAEVAPGEEIVDSGKSDKAAADVEKPGKAKAKSEAKSTTKSGE